MSDGYYYPPGQPPRPRDNRHPPQQPPYPPLQQPPPPAYGYGYYPPGPPPQVPVNPYPRVKSGRRWVIPACACAAFLVLLTILLTHLNGNEQSDSWQQGYRDATSDPGDTERLVADEGSPAHYCRAQADRASFPPGNGVSNADYFDGCIAGVRYVQSHY